MPSTVPRNTQESLGNPLVGMKQVLKEMSRAYIGIEGRVKVGRILEDLKRRVKFTLPKERFLCVSSTMKINLWKMWCVCERHRQTVVQTQGRKMRRWVRRVRIQSFFFQGYPFILFPSQEEFCSPHQVNVLNKLIHFTMRMNQDIKNIICN